MVTADAAQGHGPAGRPPAALVANLPYNVAVPVVLHLLATFPSLRRGLVMVQAEVADRMSAPPGSRTYGMPSAKLAWYADARRAGSVSRSAFWPVPRVDSGLVAFTVRPPGRGPAGPAGSPGLTGLPEPAGSPGLQRGQRVGGDSRGRQPVAGGGVRGDRRGVRPAPQDAAGGAGGWAGSARRPAEGVLRAAGVDPGLRGESLGIAEFTAIAAAA